VTLKIKQGGTAIRTITLAATTGQQQTSWDGRDSNGGLVSGGSYDATIELVAGGKTATSSSLQITALRPPIAIPGADQVVDLTATVHFNGSVSHDPDDGTGPGQGITAWSWSFPGGTPASATTRIASTTYSTVGEKTVTLTVTDNEGDQASATCTITVTLPVAYAGEDQVVKNVTDTVYFDGSGSHDPDDGTGPGQGITAWSWSFPGGTPASATTQTASTTYNTQGKKIVTLTVTDNEGHQVSNTCTVVVSPPVAQISANQVVAINTPISFDGSGSHDPDDGTGSGQGITAWSWSFPGGTPASATTEIASTTYNTAGEKTVTLTVTDNDTPALEAIDTLTVTVIDFSIDLPSTKVALPTIQVQGSPSPSDIDGAAIKWEITIDGPTYTTTTTGGNAGTITVTSFPSSNGNFGANTVTATLTYKGVSISKEQVLNAFIIHRAQIIPPATRTGITTGAKPGGVLESIPITQV
jgi:PKD repeat protein